MLCKGDCGRILTIEQEKTTQLCEWCAKKHAQEFKDRFNLNKEEK